VFILVAVAAIGRGLHGPEDVHIPGAAAEMTAERRDDFLASGLRRPFEQTAGGQQHARRAEPALQSVLLVKGLLQRHHRVAVRDPLQRLDGCAIHLHRQAQTGEHRLAVHAHHARAATAVLAADMRGR